MSLAQLFADLLLVYAVALSILITLQIIAASLYDIRLAKLRHQRFHHPYTKAYRSRPVVTVIVLAHNHAPRLIDCLDSLRRSSYRKLQILVVDNASTDDTKATAHDYLSKYPKLNVRLISKRKAADRTTLFNSIRRYIRGELIVVLDGSGHLDKAAIRQAVRQFQDHPYTDVLIPDILPRNVRTLSGLLQSYRAMLGQRSQKAASLLTQPSETSLLICRRQALGLILLHKPVTAAYADDVHVQIDSPHAYRLSHQNHSTQLTRALVHIFNASQLLVTIITPILISYFIYLAVGLREPLFLLVTMGGVALLLLFAVWENDRLGVRERLAYSVGIPITYSSLYINAWWKFIKTFRRPATY